MAAATEEKVKTPPRSATTFVVFVRPKGEVQWTLLEKTYDGKTQDEGKRNAARGLGEDEHYASFIQNDGLEIAVTSARSFKPVLVKVEPQPAKVVIK